MEGYRNKRRRKVASRLVHVSFLIVTEGTTEKLYLDNMVHRLSRVVIRDKGKSSVRLVKEAIAYKQREEFDRIWVVFDKDDNNDFNEAIELARNNDIKVAWSNEAFELWFYLHFQYLSNAVSRPQYITMLEREIRKTEPTFKYSKTDKGMYEKLQAYGRTSQVRQQRNIVPLRRAPRSARAVAAGHRILRRRCPRGSLGLRFWDRKLLPTAGCLPLPAFSCWRNKGRRSWFVCYSLRSRGLDDELLLLRPARVL